MPLTEPAAPPLPREETLQRTAPLKGELEYIIELVEPGTRVLDLGCGTGDLLKALQERKRVFPQGVDIDEEAIQVCVSKGLPVYHGDLDEGLADFGDQALDYVILTNVIQVLHRPDFLMREAARVGRRVIVSFPNFAHWSARLQLALLGRMPRTKRLPYEWYDSPNIHLTTIRDFQELLGREKLRIHRRVFLRSTRDGRFVPVRLWPNLLAEQAIFMVSRD